MAKAIIQNFKDVTKPRLLATVTYENGEVTIKSRSVDLKKQLQRGIKGRGGQVYTVTDGDHFVRELPYAFSGSLVRARVVK